MQKPFYQLQHLHDVIRHFTPNWFTTVMGTGVVAFIIAEMPFAHAVMWDLRRSPLAF